MPWNVLDGPRRVPAPGFDGERWAWRLREEPGEAERIVSVLVSGSALAAATEGLPPVVAETRGDHGERLVASYAGWLLPPLHVEVATTGVTEFEGIRVEDDIFRHPKIADIWRFFGSRGYSLLIHRVGNTWAAPYMLLGSRLGSAAAGTGETPVDAAEDALRRFAAERGEQEPPDLEGSGSDQHTQLLELTSQALRDAGFDVSVNQFVAGIEADFLVRGPHGETIVVEAKTYPPTESAAVRAADQARRYQQAMGADAAFIVVPAHVPGSSENVVTPDELPDRLASVVARPSDIAPPMPARPAASVARSIFAAMPFAAEYDDVYFIAMIAAAEAVGAVCIRVDQDQYVGDVVDRIRSRIERCMGLFADVSEAKANVMYEVGLAYGLGKPTVQLSRTPLNELPFDIRNENTLAYASGQIYQLRDDLIQRAIAVFGTESAAGG